jgi:hypothetical protein
MIRQQQAKAAILLLLLLCVSLWLVSADPGGVSISGASSVTATNVTPASRSDARTTITTMVVNSIQQTSRWKAYVGNVSGSLALSNPNNYSIYSWDLTTTTGEVYASRFGNLTWSSVSCATTGLIHNESSFFYMQNSDADRINATFNWTVHKLFQVGSSTISQNSCNSTVTYRNSTRQAPTTSSPFQEILIQDTNGYMVYLADISDNTLGYDNSSAGNTFDFQMIVAENTTGSPTPYYFYVELG